jgi:hypothetical protein
MFATSEGLKLAGKICTKLGEAMQGESDEGQKLTTGEITEIVVEAVTTAAADFADEDDK